MKIKLNNIKRDYKVIGITLIAGLFFGWLFFHGSNDNVITDQATEEHAPEKNTLWTCSMHPQIKLDHPGNCPICGMELIPLDEYHAEHETNKSPDEIQMTPDAIKIADIQTLVVKKAYPDKQVYLLGKVKPDERNIAELTARFGGRIEKLFVNFTGQHVKKGEKLASIYSPALMTAQKELLEAVDYKETNPDFYKAARNKLKLWDLSDDQINDIENSGKIKDHFDILSPIEGTVTQRNVAIGDYVKEGSSLFQVIDLTKVWVMFEAYESDLPWIKMGDKVNFTVQSLPGKNFTGNVSFVDPVIDPSTRIAQVRVEVRNPGMELKPEMFANGIVTSAFAEARKDLLIPKTAVLWTGKRSVVYVKVPDREEPSFLYREIILGPEAGDYYVVSSGLKEGEEIAVNGVFKIDAAAQLAGKPSMMDPEGGSGGGSMANMPGMNMGKKKETSMVKNVVYREQEESKSKTGETEFKKQLTKVYDAYLPLKNAFVKSDPNATADAAEKVGDALKNVNMELLKGDAHMDWMKQLNTLSSGLKKIKNSKDIEMQRGGFAEFSLALHQAIKEFGMDNATAYYQYCPMAFNSKGAYWLSESENIQNPYFGKKMLTCGDTKETLKF